MRTLIAVFAFALPLVAQESKPTAPKVVVIQAGVACRPAPAKVIHIAPAPAVAPTGAYEGTRDQRSWQWYGSGGPARANASYRVWRTRFSPVRSYGFGGYTYLPYGSYPITYRR